MTSFSTFPSARRGLATVLAALALAPLAAHARNDVFFQPMAPALRHEDIRLVIDKLPLGFGKASADGADAMGAEFIVEGTGDASFDNANRRDQQRPSDTEVCDRAFKDALKKLIAAARKAGAGSVVGIVSNYKGHVLDDASQFECHAGSFHSIVALQGQLARGVTVSSSSVGVSARALPPATGFAALDDLQAVPISAAGKERYAHFLTLPKPRAFTVSEDGAWRFYSGDPEAMTKALDYCARAGKPCWLYAVDDRVVWSPDLGKRIGRSSQLAPAAAADKDDHQ